MTLISRQTEGQPHQRQSTAGKQQAPQRSSHSQATVGGRKRTRRKETLDDDLESVLLDIEAA